MSVLGGAAFGGQALLAWAYCTTGARRGLRAGWTLLVAVAIASGVVGLAASAAANGLSSGVLRGLFLAVWGPVVFLLVTAGDGIGSVLGPCVEGENI